MEPTPRYQVTPETYTTALPLIPGVERPSKSKIEAMMSQLDLSSLNNNNNSNSVNFSSLSSNSITSSGNFLEQLGLSSNKNS